MKVNYNKKEHKEWAKKIKQKFNNQCIVCGSDHYLTAHHLITAHNEKTRYKEWNGIPLCAKHHTKYGTGLSPHNENAMIFFLWLEKHYPEIMIPVEDYLDNETR